MLISTKQVWNNSETVSVFYFCFLSHARASETDYKTMSTK